MYIFVDYAILPKFESTSMMCQVELRGCLYSSCTVWAIVLLACNQRVIDFYAMRANSARNEKPRPPTRRRRRRRQLRGKGARRQNTSLSSKKPLKNKNKHETTAAAVSGAISKKKKKNRNNLKINRTQAISIQFFYHKKNNIGPPTHHSRIHAMHLPNVACVS